MNFSPFIPSDLNSKTTPNYALFILNQGINLCYVALGYMENQEEKDKFVADTKKIFKSFKAGIKESRKRGGYYE